MHAKVANGYIINSLNIYYVVLYDTIISYVFFSYTFLLHCFIVKALPVHNVNLYSILNPKHTKNLK